MRFVTRSIPLKGLRERYKITTSGKVYDSLGKPLRISLNSCGYMRVKLHFKDGSTQRYFVHRLVAITYIPNPRKLPVVMHLDNDKTHNWVGNLAWGTYSDNLLQASREHRLPTIYKKGLGNGLRGDNHPQSKLTLKQREEVRKLYHTGKYTLTSLGRIYSVSRVTIAKYV